MKKITFLLITILTVNFTTAQSKVEQLTEYKASNGITYKIGDDIILGQGSGVNGAFVYIRMAGWMGGGQVQSFQSGTYAVIKKITKNNRKRFKKVVFTIGAGDITNYSLDIEDAIKTCEVENCTKEAQDVMVVPDKFDQLKKLKELFDNGVLSQEEYNAEKKKILGQK